jgi:hypothetical protein
MNYVDLCTRRVYLQGPAPAYTGMYKLTAKKFALIEWKRIRNLVQTRGLSYFMSVPGIKYRALRSMVTDGVLTERQFREVLRYDGCFLCQWVIEHSSGVKNMCRCCPLGSRAGNAGCGSKDSPYGVLCTLTRMYHIFWGEIPLGMQKRMARRSLTAVDEIILAVKRW